LELTEEQQAAANKRIQKNKALLAKEQTELDWRQRDAEAAWANWAGE